MSKNNDSPQKKFIISQYNDGCKQFEISIQKVQELDFDAFENNLRTGGASIFNALELAIKEYIKFYLNDPVLSSKYCSTTQKVNFHDLLLIIKTRGNPHLDDQTFLKLNFFRNKMRNPTEHEGDIPSVRHMNEAISLVRNFLITYLLISDSDLTNVQIPNDVKSILEPQKEEYFEKTREIFEYMDLGGISPRVGNKIVKIRMEDLFVPLKVEVDVPLIESIEEEKKLSLSTDSKIISSSKSPSLCEEKNKDLDLFETDFKRHSTRPINIIQMLEKPKVVLLGHPGSGKTTVGKYIAYSIANKQFSKVGQIFEPLIPISIKVSDYAMELRATPNLSLFEFIVKKSTDRFSKLFEWYLKNDLAICILDGLDEIPFYDLQITTIRRIEQFISEFNNNRFLITSRIVGYRKNQISGDFFQVTLIDFDQEQTQHFLKKWHTAIEIESSSKISEHEIDEKVAKLMDAINSNIGIRKLAGNPLLLTIIALANWRGTKLPNRRVDLYQIASETLIENWPFKQRQLRLDSNEILKILEPIAYTIFTSGKNNLIREQELKPLFEEKVIEQRGINPQEAKIICRDLFEDIEVGTGFFLARGLDSHHQKLFGFLHLTFGEYLTARYVAEQWLSDNFSIDLYAHNDRWHEIILLIAGHLSSYSQVLASKFVRSILDLNSEFEDVLHRDLLLTAEILSDNVKVDRDLENEIISKLITISLETKHKQLFEYIIECLNKISKNFPIGTPQDLLKIVEKDESEFKIKKSIILHFIGKTSTELCKYILQGLYEKDEILEYSVLFLNKIEFLEMNKNMTHILLYSSKLSLISSKLSKETADLFFSASSNILTFDDIFNQDIPKDEELPTLCIITLEEILNADLEKLTTALQKGKYPFFLIIMFMFEFQKSKSELINNFLSKILSSILSSTELKRIGPLVEIYQLLSIFQRHNSQILSPEISSQISEVIDKVQPLLTDDAFDLRQTAFRFLLTNHKEKRASIFVQGLDDKDEKIRALTINFTPKESENNEIIFKRLFECLNNDFSQVVRYRACEKIIELGIFKNNDIPKLYNNLKNVPTDESDLNKKIAFLCNLTSLSEKSKTMELNNCINQRIYDLLLKFETEKINVKDISYYKKFDVNEDLAKKIRGLCISNNPSIQIISSYLWMKIRSKNDVFPEFRSVLTTATPEVKMVIINAANNSDLSGDNLILLTDLLYDQNDEISIAASSRLRRIKNISRRREIIDRIKQKGLIKINDPPFFSVIWDILVLPHLDKISTN